MSKSRMFNQRLEECQQANQSLVCVGLDPHLDKLPTHFDPRPRDVLRFNRAIIEATKDLVCAYKPNLAFYESLGRKGWKVLRQTIRAVPDGIPVILDAKRGDIGNTAAMYAKAMFDELGGDAVTVNPLMGSDTLEPFLQHRDKGVFVLCLTSNPGSKEFQVKHRLHHQIARTCMSWAEINSNVGLVVGATHPKSLAEIRAICPSQVFLLPGVGAQGGDLEAAIRAGVSHRSPNLIINASRSIIHASRGRDFDEVARREAKKLRKAVQTCLEQMSSSKISTPSSEKS